MIKKTHIISFFLLAFLVLSVSPLIAGDNSGNGYYYPYSYNEPNNGYNYPEQNNNNNQNNYWNTDPCQNDNYNHNDDCNCNQNQNYNDNYYSEDYCDNYYYDDQYYYDDSNSYNDQYYYDDNNSYNQPYWNTPYYNDNQNNNYNDTYWTEANNGPGDNYYQPDYNEQSNHYDGIEIIGPSDFVQMIKMSLEAVERNSSMDYEYIKEHIRKIDLQEGYMDKDTYAFAIMGGNYYGDYSIHFNQRGLPEIPTNEYDLFIGSVILHEGVHLAGGDEPEAYTEQIEALKRMGASQELVNATYELYMVATGNSDYSYNYNDNYYNDDYNYNDNDNYNYNDDYNYNDNDNYNDEYVDWNTIWQLFNVILQEK